MPKLYTHSRLIDLEFRNAYKEIDNQIETIVEEGLSGPTGNDGPDGMAGVDGLDSTLKVFKKYLVSLGAIWRLGVSEVACPLTYIGSPEYWEIKDQAVINAEYLARDYFTIDLLGNTDDAPIFIFPKKVLIQRVHLHLIEPFFADNDIYGGAFNYGLSLFLVGPDEDFEGNMAQIAWSGPIERMFHQTYFSDGGLIATPSYNPLDRMCPRPVVEPDNWEEPHTLSIDDSFPYLYRDPETTAFTHPRFRRAWGSAGLVLEAGTKLFAGDVETSYLCPGWEGPTELQAGEGVNHHGQPHYRMLPSDKFPLGGGCISIVVVYHELD